MSLVEDYYFEIKPRINQIIANTMYEWVDPLKETINKVSGRIKGDYSRPRLFGDGTYQETVGYDYVEINNNTRMQGSDYGVPEVVFVEEGFANYNMPGPRPFMEEAGQEFADGKGSELLQDNLNKI